MRAIKKLFLNDKFILSLILLNSIVIFGEGFQMDSLGFMKIIHILDSIFTFAFLLELIVKARHFGWKKYINSSWNKLDFILVILSLPSILLLFVDDNIAGISFVLVFRIARVFKFVRFLKFIPGITDLAKGVQRALKTSVVILIGFILYNFIISILSCYMFKGISPQYFGDPIHSFYSTFKIFTVEGWYEIPDKMTLDLSAFQTFFIKLYFIVILITGGIFGLSLVNSIFVDAMVSDNNDELEKKVDELTAKIDVLIDNQKK